MWPTPHSVALNSGQKTVFAQPVCTRAFCTDYMLCWYSDCFPVIGLLEARYWILDSRNYSRIQGIGNCVRSNEIALVARTVRDLNRRNEHVVQSDRVLLTPLGSRCCQAKFLTGRLRSVWTPHQENQVSHLYFPFVLNRHLLGWRSF